MSDDGLGNFLGSLVLAVISAVLIVVGDIVAVTVWIPHAGHHHHPPSLLDYIALYCVFALAQFLWAIPIGLVAIAFE